MHWITLLTLAAVCLVPAVAVAGNETTLPADAVAHKDVVYAARPTGPVKLDVFTPPGDGPFPVVMWIHGGAWKLGSKDIWTNMNWLVGHGYAVVNVDYRLSQVAPYPAQIVDCESALAFVSEHAADYRLDPKRIAITGESAGGHLAALLALRNVEPAKATAATTSPARPTIRCVIDLFGPTDLIAQDAVMKKLDNDQDTIDQLLGGPIETKLDLAKEASPLTHVTKAAPPFLILHGTDDSLVPIEQSQRLVDALKTAGAIVEFYPVKGAGHAGDRFWDEACREKMLAFLKTQLVP